MIGTPKLTRAYLISGTALGSLLALTALSAVGQEMPAGDAASPAPTREQIDVIGRKDYKTDIPALSKLTEPVIDTPTSIVTIPKDRSSMRPETLWRSRAPSTSHRRNIAPGRASRM